MKLKTSFLRTIRTATHFFRLKDWGCRYTTPLLFLVLFVFPSSLPAYRWPVDEVYEKKISSTLGEPRPTDKKPTRFHTGIDILAPKSSKVYSVETGTIPKKPILKLKGGYIVHTHGKIKKNDAYLMIGNNRYVHIDKWDRKKYPPGDTVEADTAFAKVGVENHLHFEEWDLPDSLPSNPLQSEHLEGSPEFDTLWPKVMTIYFLKNDTDTVLATESDGTTILSAKIDIVALAYDEIPDSPDRFNVSPYLMLYKIENAEGVTVHSDTSFRFVNLPPKKHHSQVYKRQFFLTDGTKKTTTKKTPYYITTYKEGSTHQYWNTKQKEGEPEDVDADSIGEAKFRDGRYTAWVLTWDLANNGGDTLNEKGALKKKVIIDNFLPVVASTYPDSGQSGVPPEADIKATFSEPMAESTITSSRITVVKMGDPPDTVAGVLSYSDSTCTLTFDPDSSLEAGGGYEVILSDSLTDLANNRLDGDENGVAGGDYSWRFTVAGEVCWLYEDEEDEWYGGSRVGCAAALKFQNNLQHAVRVKAITYNFYSWQPPQWPLGGHVWNVDESSGEPIWVVVPKPGTTGVAHRNFEFSDFGLWKDTTFTLPEPSDSFVPGERFAVGWQVIWNGQGNYSGWNDTSLHNYHSWWYNSEIEEWYPICEQPVPPGPRDGVWTMEVLVEVVAGGKGESGGDLVVLSATTAEPSRTVLEKASAVNSPQRTKAHKEAEPYFSGAWARARHARSVILGDEGRASPQSLGSEFQLFQNSPNPCPAITCIRYSLPSDLRVHLAVYDITGKLVATLVDERQGAGDHMAIWNGRSESPPPDGEFHQVSGFEYPAGIYLYRLQASDPALSGAEGFTATKKLILLR